MLNWPEQHVARGKSVFVDAASTLRENESAARSREGAIERLHWARRAATPVLRMCLMAFLDADSR